MKYAVADGVMMEFPPRLSNSSHRHMFPLDISASQHIRGGETSRLAQSRRLHDGTPDFWPDRTSCRYLLVWNVCLSGGVCHTVLSKRLPKSHLSGFFISMRLAQRCISITPAAVDTRGYIIIDGCKLSPEYPGSTSTADRSVPQCTHDVCDMYSLHALTERLG